MQRTSCFARAARVFAPVMLASMSIGSPRPVLGADALVLVCGTKSATSYDIIRNGVPVTTGASTVLGSLLFAMDVSTGTLVSVAPIGDLAPPAPPLFSSVETTTPGCATASWVASGDPTVVGYVVAYGRQSVAGGGATNYEHTMDVPAVASADVCFLEKGIHYFAVRSRNVAGMLSGYSSERSVEILVVTVLISRFDARAQPDGVHLSWRVEADEVVRGYRVYRSSAGDQQRVVADELPGHADSFIDVTARPGIAYTYVLAAIKANGEEVISIPAIASMMPLTLELEPNVPNPFNPTTQIGFTLPEAESAILRIYDVRGAHVSTVLDARLEPGRHHVEWNGLDDTGNPVASGTYFYTLAAGKQKVSRKMVLVK